MPIRDATLADVFGAVPALPGAMDVRTLNQLAQVNRELNTLTSQCDVYRQTFFTHERRIHQSWQRRGLSSSHRCVEGVPLPAGITYKALLRGAAAERYLFCQPCSAPLYEENFAARERYYTFVLRDIDHIRRNRQIAAEAHAAGMASSAAAHAAAMQRQRRQVQGEACRLGAVLCCVGLLALGAVPGFFLPPWRLLF